MDYCYLELEKRYLSSIGYTDPFTHEFNYQFIDFFFIESQKKGLFTRKDETYYTGILSIIDRVNYHINLQLHNEDNINIIAYYVIIYLLKKEMGFNIKKLMVEKDFINVIQWHITNISLHYEKEKRGRVNNKGDNLIHSKQQNEKNEGLEHTQMTFNKMVYLKEFFNLLIDILYTNDKSKTNNINIKEETNFKNHMILTYDFLIMKTHLKYGSYKFRFDNNDSINDIELDELMNEILADNGGLKQETTYKTKLNSTSETKQKDETSNHYASISKLLKPYITNSNSSKYKSIFEDKGFKKGTRCIIFNKANQKEMCLFAETFGLSLEQLKSIAKLKDAEGLKDISIKEAYFSKNKRNQIINPIGFERALKTIKTDHLNKLNISLQSS